MRKIISVLLLFLGSFLFSQELEGEWVSAFYSRNSSSNYLEEITLTKISEQEYKIEHIYQLFPNRNYTVVGIRIEPRKIQFIDPFTEWTMFLSVRKWGPTRDVLERTTSEYDEICRQYQRVDDEYLQFKENLDSWIEENDEVPGEEYFFM